MVGDNKIECDAPLDLNNCKLTVKGTGTLTVVGNGRSDNWMCNGAIFDSAYTGYVNGKGNLCLEGGTVTARGGDYNAISVRFVKLQGGKLEAYGGSNAGIVCSYLYTYGGSLYATGDDYGIGMRTAYAENPGNLAILASDEKDASMAEMDAGDIGDIKNNAKKKTYYIGDVTGPLLSVKAQKGALYEGVAAQKATFAISAKNVNTDTLKAQWVGDHYGLTESLSTDGKTLTVTTDATVKQGTYCHRHGRNDSHQDRYGHCLRLPPHHQHPAPGCLRQLQEWGFGCLAGRQGNPGDCHTSHRPDRGHFLPVEAGGRHRAGRLYPVDPLSEGTL